MNKMHLHAITVNDYIAAYANPISGKVGDLLRMGRNDDEWPGWVWCTGPDGREGWVPEAYIDIGPPARLRLNYDARELSVQLGETLEILFSQSGWHYARRASGECGWVPENVVQIMEG